MTGLTVVVVSHNTREYLEKCLLALSSSLCEVVVADNASIDGSQQLVRERYPQVRLLAFDENLGFGRAFNEAARLVSGRLLLVLNPDAWPVDGGLEKLESYVDRHPKVGVAGPTLLHPDGRLQRSINGYPTMLWRGRSAVPGSPSPKTPWKKRRIRMAAFRLRWRHRRGDHAGAAVQGRALDRHFLKGAVLLFRREALDCVGGFDDDFFLFGEDIDICYRIRQAGWRVAYVPDATFVHVGGSSTRRDWGQSYREQLRGHLRFLAKHRGGLQAELARHFLVAALRSRAFRRGREGVPFAEAARWLASAPVKVLLNSGKRVDALGRRP